MSWPKGRPRYRVCHYCGVEFKVKNATGRLPIYCKPTHNRAAKRAREKFRRDWWANVHAGLRRR